MKILLVSIAVIIVSSLIIYMIIKKMVYITADKNIEILTMLEVIQYFKSHIEVLKVNKSFLPVVIKKMKKDKIICTVCVYDENKEEVISSPATFTWVANSLDEDLKNAFGNKDMIILN